MIAQLALFPDPAQEPASTPVRASAAQDTAPVPEAVPAPRVASQGAFYVGGWRVWRVDVPFGGDEALRAAGGWRCGRIGQDGSSYGAYSPAALRAAVIFGARAAGLPPDLFARGWQRDARPAYAHWLHWPGNSVSCVLATLEINIAAARTMRPMDELRAWHVWRAQQPTKKAKRTRRAA